MAFNYSTAVLENVTSFQEVVKGADVFAGGFYGEFIIVSFMVVILIATSKQETHRSFFYASFCGMFISILLMFADLESYNTTIFFVVLFFASLILVTFSEK